MLRKKVVKVNRFRDQVEDHSRLLFNGYIYLEVNKHMTERSEQHEHQPFLSDPFVSIHTLLVYLLVAG